MPIENVYKYKRSNEVDIKKPGEAFEIFLTSKLKMNEEGRF